MNRSISLASTVPSSTKLLIMEAKDFEHLTITLWGCVILFHCILYQSMLHLSIKGLPKGCVDKINLSFPQ